MAAVQFCLLGPLLVRCDDHMVAIPAAKHRAVLAALLLRAGRVVSLDELTEVLWGADPPAAARASVQNYVMRLRKNLGQAGTRISTWPGGYLIQVGEGELDLARFESLIRQGRVAARGGNWQQASEQLAKALALWRGEPLADVGSDVLAARDGSRLAELRLQALETRIEADLHCGRHPEVIGELRQLTAEQPLRERLRELLMLALYQDGRQAEALAEYQKTRQVLVNELRAEPGPELQRLHQQILTADPALALAGQARPARATPSSAASAVPRELPSPVGQFTGRTAELSALTSLIDGAGQERPGDKPTTTVLISAIGGTAGVGKTALAVHWAHQVSDRFPDGQLYANLRGYDPEQPVAAADVLAGFLRSLGIPGQDIPAEAGERAARYRSLLAGRKTLVVLDNAGSVEQVRPLLPGSPGCAVVVTSRDALAGLVARDGAVRIDLDVLPLPDSVALLRELIGSRADDDVAAAKTMAEHCSRLPLALRVAAELAAARPDVSLAELADELADRHKRLDILDAGGDPRTAVRAVFSWSYRNLDRDAARAFRLVGLHPGAELEPYAVAALTGTAVAQARATLAVLARAHLIQFAGPHRYGMHDLLRAYAQELAADLDDEQEERFALTRLFDHYLSVAAKAMDTLYRGEYDYWLRRMSAPVGLEPPVTTANGARVWLDTTRATLVAVIAHSANHGWPYHATRLASVLSPYLDKGYRQDALKVHTLARSAARQVSDLAAEADALTHLGTAERREGNVRQATEYHQQSLTLFRAAGDRAGQAYALVNLGLAQRTTSSYDEAADSYRQAIALFREVDSQGGEAKALTYLGIIEQLKGHLQQAANHQQRALALYRLIKDPHGVAVASTNLAITRAEMGDLQQATEHFRQALELYRETGDRLGEAGALGNLGIVAGRLGRYQTAIENLVNCIAIKHELGDRLGEAANLNNLGDAYLAAGQSDEARVRHEAALALALEVGHRFTQAFAHNGLGHDYSALRDGTRAREHWEQALAIYSELGVPEADEVRVQLTGSVD